MAIKSVRYLLAGLVLAALPVSSFAFVSVGISVNFAPPPLPVYAQPPCPVVGYIWTPGYWAYDDDDYYWVPGTWIAPPEPGFLWTPGYWGFVDGAYLWHAGYWGPHVGFYGGVNYGFGYTGVGFAGGYWRDNEFFYNRAVTNLQGVQVTNVYNTTVVNNVTVNHVSYNGGPGGISLRPNVGELAAEHDRHVAFTSAQREQEHMAAGNHELRASANEGRPRIAATQRAGDFAGRGVIAARSAGGPVHTPRGGEAHGGPAHVTATRNEMPARADRPPGATGNGGGDRFVQNSHERTPQHAGSAEPRPQMHNQAQMHEPQSHAQPQHYRTQAEPQSHGSAQVTHEQRAPQQMHEQRPPQQMHEQRPPQQMHEQRPPQQMHEQRPPQQMHEQRPPQQMHEQRAPQQMHEQRAPQVHEQRPQESHQARAQPRNEQHPGEPRR